MLCSLRENKKKSNIIIKLHYRHTLYVTVTLHHVIHISNIHINSSSSVKLGGKEKEREKVKAKAKEIERAKENLTALSQTNEVVQI